MLILASTGRRTVHIGIISVLLLVTALAWLPQEVRGGANQPAPSASGPAKH
jgi:hypothetical protein